MADKPEPPDPKVLAAVRDVVSERGWVFVGDARNEVYTAELPGAGAQVSSGSADGLVRAINSYEERERQTKPDWTPVGPMIVTEPVDIENEEEEEESE